MKLAKQIASKFAIFWIMLCIVMLTEHPLTNSKLLVQKNGKNYSACLIPKIWQILKYFARQFYQV